jgi:hypothetical protein
MMNELRAAKIGMRWFAEDLRKDLEWLDPYVKHHDLRHPALTEADDLLGKGLEALERFLYGDDDTGHGLSDDQAV